MKAKVAPVQVGSVSVEGLQLPDGSYAIAVVQVANILDFQPLKKNAPRELKPILGKAFQPRKCFTELNPVAANILTLAQFSVLLVQLTAKGNKQALSLLLAATEETLERRFDKAFEVKRTEDEYNDRLDARLKGKVARRSLTDQWKDYYQAIGEKPPYAKLTMMCLHTVGFTPGRDNKTTEELRLLDHCETTIASRIAKGDTPIEALRFYAKYFC